MLRELRQSLIHLFEFKMLPFTGVLQKTKISAPNFVFLGSHHCVWSLTQTVEAERSVVKEVADVAGLWGHGAEGVSTAGGEGVNADEQHVHQQGPGVAVGQEVQSGAEDAETPQEVPENHHSVLFQHVYNDQLNSKRLLSDFDRPVLFKAVVLGLFWHPGLVSVWCLFWFRLIVFLGIPPQLFPTFLKNLIVCFIHLFIFSSALQRI